MKIFGLTGYPLSHSFSRTFFRNKFQVLGLADHKYENFPAGNVGKVVRIITDNPDLYGLNVTIPLKEKIIRVLNEMDTVAEKIQAVNTIKIERVKTGVKLTGFNTDAHAFTKSIISVINKSHDHALILGTGGAAKAVGYSLTNLGIKYLSVSRTHVSQSVISYNALIPEIIQKYKLIINATPVGMFPDVDHCPDIPYKYIGKEHLLFDLIYNPGETLFIKNGKARGAQTMNGIEMLYLQAEESWKIWNA